MKARSLKLWLAATLLTAGNRFAGADLGALEFVRPRDRSTVVGPAVVELSVVPPAGSTVESVSVLLDGAVIATLKAPPWRASWDAGDGLKTHFLQAIARFSDGTERRVSVRTSPLKVDLIEQVALVNVYAIVRDKQSQYIKDLKRENFRITETDRIEEIDRFSTEWRPLRIAIVLDTSLSMEGSKLESARDAATSFLESFRPEDQAIVVTFGDDVNVAQDMTGDREKLRNAILNTHAKGGTALYDAIWKAADLLDQHDGRRVLVLLSDGRDEASSGLEPGSLHTDQEALDRALRSETMIFAIGFGRNLASEYDFFRRRPLGAILQEMAEASGGRASFSSRTAKLRKSFDEVVQDLRHQYSLAYASDNARRDGAWRPIRVTVDREGCQVIARKGYFAPKESAAR